MKRLLFLFLIPALAFGALSGDFSTKSTTLGVQGTGCTAAGGAACVVFGKCSAATGSTLCTSATATWNVADYTTLALTIRNAGANTLSDVLVEFSDDGTNFEVWDSTTFDEMATLTVKSMQISGNSRKFIRVEGRSASGTDVVATLAVNDG